MKMMIIGGAIALLALGAASVTVVPTRTEHGWKTPYVVATRYSNPQMGFNVGFRFPMNPNDCDRAEIFEFIEMHGGNILQGGGSPGAEEYAQFKGVTDPPTADAKIKEILPGLTLLMININNGAYTALLQKRYKAWDLAHNPQWPDTTPPDKTDPHWKFNNNANINGIPYLKVEVSPGKWQWEVNKEFLKVMQDDENARWELYYSLAKRKLSHDELMRVYESMNVSDMQPYFRVDVDAAMYDMLVKQWELQTGKPMEGYVPLSTAKGEYNRSPQEEDNGRAVGELIIRLQKMTETKAEVHP